MYKDKRAATDNPKSCEEPPCPLNESRVEIADDYTKRKNVFRVRTQHGSEYLFQAECESAMQEWVKTIEAAALALVVYDRDSAANSASTDKGGTKTGIKKLTSFRSTQQHSVAVTESNSATNLSTTPTTSKHSPSSTAKSRKTSTIDSQAFDKDKKTWKGKVAKQLKKIHPGSHHHSGSSASKGFPPGSSIGVPLELCPMSEDHPLVPLLVANCCAIVEERGLEIVGVYRVPGNSAAVSLLTDLVNNKGVDGGGFSAEEEPRWHDVNVVSSLLKSFFRKLPEPLFTTELYPLFIEASKEEDAPAHRLLSIKRLIFDLPQHHYETLRLLSRHLCKVVEKSAVNKMETRNIAIVFGPTLVRAGDDNMISMVTDMAQQCRIIESILNYCDWFFNEDDWEAPEVTANAPTSNHLVCHIGW